MKTNNKDDGDKEVIEKQGRNAVNRFFGKCADNFCHLVDFSFLMKLFATGNSGTVKKSHIFVQCNSFQSVIVGVNVPFLVKVVDAINTLKVVHSCILYCLCSL